MYGHKQDLMAWFLRLYNHLQKKGYKRGSSGNNLYIKIENQNMIICVVYMDDIIFKSNLNPLRKKFPIEVKKYFEMSMIGELTFFFGLEVSK